MVDTLKTVGVANSQGGKDYLISFGQEEYLCIRKGNSWTCNGEHFPSVKSIKETILSGWFDRQPEDDEVEAKAGVWDCVDPCALLVLQLKGKEFDDEVRRTLDSFGWIKDGQLDEDRALRDFERHAIKPPPAKPTTPGLRVQAEPVADD